MHILVTNDDGPPSHSSSPYIYELIQSIKRTRPDWVISVALPKNQCSWIGKSHLILKNVNVYCYIPGDSIDSGALSEYNESKRNDYWYLIDGTPATAVQIGLFHLFTHLPPIDLVISGPNYGRNVTAAFALSSGTIGAAMEASLCGFKSIALSFAYYGDTALEIAPSASSVAVRLFDYLYNNWNQEADLYSINIPLRGHPEAMKIYYTDLLRNKWASCYSPLNLVNESHPSQNTYTWSPQFNVVYDSFQAPGSDGWIVESGGISVTPLRSVFSTPKITETEIVLSQEIFNVVVDFDDAWTQRCMLNALARFKNISLTTLANAGNSKLVHIAEYERLDFDRLHKCDSDYMANSYVIRKALIRKHYLDNTIAMHTCKHKDSILATSTPQTWTIELDYAEYLDEALYDSYDLVHDLEQNELCESDKRKWFILKPAMSDRGQGIRLFSTMDELTAIFEGFDNEDPSDTGVLTSMLRIFVIQRYIELPLLINNRKFHIRVYALACGKLSVYIYKECLALFASQPYTAPSTSNTILGSHITNTCFQLKPKENSVELFWQLDLLNDSKELIFSQISQITGELFNAAHKEQLSNFQPLPNCYEIYGLDFVVDEALQVKLLEVNAYPDFKQSGDSLQNIIEDLFEHTIRLAILRQSPQQCMRRVL